MMLFKKKIEFGLLFSTYRQIVRKAMRNADSLREAISPEAWLLRPRYGDFLFAAVFARALRTMRHAK